MAGPPPCARPRSKTATIFDAVVVGGGLLGTATAYHLVSAGARTVLVDRADVGRATDILRTLSHPSLWQLLVEERGWTPDEYEAWCAETTCAQLLRASPRPTGPYTLRRPQGSRRASPAERSRSPSDP